MPQEIVSTSLRALIPEEAKKWETDEDTFWGWSPNDFRLFESDILANTQQERLKGIAPGSQLVFIRPGMGATPDYGFATVTELQAEQQTATIEFMQDITRHAKINLQTGINTKGPDLGWVAPFDIDEATRVANLLAD